MNQSTFTTDKNKLIVTRTFNAPSDLVWRAWTEAELLDQWWAPSPWKSRTKSMDFSDGGNRLYAMVGPEGEEHWGLTRYRAIIKESSFEGDDVFCDENGNVNEALPVATFINVFTSDGNTTTVVMTTKYDKEDDLKTVLEMGMKEGLSMALDQLDEILRSMTSNG